MRCNKKHHRLVYWKMMVDPNEPHMMQKICNNCFRSKNVTGAFVGQKIGKHENSKIAAMYKTKYNDKF